MNRIRPLRISVPLALPLALALVIVLSLAWPGSAEARVWTVRQDGSGDFTEIQPAIDASTSGDVVEVGPGVYFESLVFGGRRIELRSSHGPEKTILDGSGEIVSIIRLIFAEPRTTRIVGFTLRSGRGTPLSEPLQGGGSEIPGDTDPMASGGLRHGGAVLCNPGSATFESVHFVGNVANRGGAFYAGSNSAPLLVDCVFRENRAGEGGAVAGFFSRPVLEGVTFRGNEAVYGGAIYDAEGGIVCRSSRFEGNIASDGGAAYLRDGIARGRFERSVFWRNLATEGAALRVLHATVDVSGSILAENHFPDCFPAQLHYSDSGGLIEQNVFYAGPGLLELEAVRCDQGGSTEFVCNLFWPSAPKETCAAAEKGQEANPFFCHPGAGDFSLRPDSPCLPGNAPGDCGGFGPESEPGCELPIVDVRSLGGGTDAQRLEERKSEPGP